MLAKTLSMTLKLDGVPRYFIRKVPRYRTRYQVSTVPLTILKKYSGTLVHGTAHHCLIVIQVNVLRFIVH